MKKMILGIRSRFAALLLGAVLGGCGTGQTDLSTNPKYSGIMGHVFETRYDMLIVQMGADTIMLDTPGEGGAPDIAELPPDLPYKAHNGAIVLGVLPAGSRFQVARIYSSWSTLGGGYTDYSMRMLTPKEYKNWTLSSIGLLDYGVRPMRFEKKLVREVEWNRPK